MCVRIADIGYGRIDVRVGDTNASFRISRLPISIFGDFQALYELPTRTRWPSWLAFCTVVLVAVVAVDSYH